MCKVAKNKLFMHDGDLNLIHFNKDNYTWYSCHEHHQGVGTLLCKFHSCLVHVNSKIRRKKWLLICARIP